MQSVLLQAKAAFARNDIGEVSRLAETARAAEFAELDSIKIFNLLGELHRKAGRIDDAIIAYSVTHRPPTRVSTAGLYGLAECYAAAGDSEAFDEAVEQLIYRKRLDPNTVSRLMVSAAMLRRTEAFKRLTAVEFPDRDLDAWYWLRRASAAFHFGEAHEVPELAAKARAAAKGDPDALLAIAEIDYDPNKYWDQRYNSKQGQHAPVPPAWRDDQAYAERTTREMAYLDQAFGKVFGPAARLPRGVDCGCGSARLSPLLVKWVEALDCYDVSETALAFARNATSQFSGLSFHQANLAESLLPARAYDLVFDFAVVQHQSDETAWKRVLANYAQAAREGGHVFLVEQRGNDGPNRYPHVRNASAASYARELVAGGCEIVFNELTPWGEICLVGRKAA